MKRQCPVVGCKEKIDSLTHLYTHLRTEHYLPTNPTSKDFLSLQLYQCHKCHNVLNKSSIGQHFNTMHRYISEPELEAFAKEHGLIVCPFGNGCKVVFSRDSFRKNKSAHLRTEVHRPRNAPLTPASSPLSRQPDTIPREGGLMFVKTDSSGILIKTENSRPRIDYRPINSKIPPRPIVTNQSHSRPKSIPRTTERHSESPKISNLLNPEVARKGPRLPPFQFILKTLSSPGC